MITGNNPTIFYLHVPPHKEEDTTSHPNMAEDMFGHCMALLKHLG
jgi:hypothetical protein